MNRSAPGPAGSDRRVEDGQQLVHADNDDHLLGLAGGDEPIVEVPDHTIESDGGESGHVEGASDLGAPAEGAALATRLSGIAIERGEPEQGSELMARQGARFRHVGEQGGDGGRPDAAYARELAGERGMMAVDVVGQLGLDAIKLLTDGCCRA